MNFTIDREIITEDGNTTVETTNYVAELVDLQANVYRVEGEEKIKVAEQPWNPKGDGTRAAWTSEEEVVAWFKENF